MHFEKAQGYESCETIMNRDNKSIMLLETNETFSRAKRTKCINIRYFCMKGRIEKGDLSINYCSAYDMLSDLCTKPLQGSKFEKFRNSIMNINKEE